MFVSSRRTRWCNRYLKRRSYAGVKNFYMNNLHVEKVTRICNKYVEKMWKREQHGGRATHHALTWSISNHLSSAHRSEKEKYFFYFLQTGHSPIVNHKRIFHMDRFCSAYGQAIACHLLLMDCFFPTLRVPLYT